MGKMQPANQLSIDELLASIRQAIDNEAALPAATRPAGAARPSALAGSTRNVRVSGEAGQEGREALTAPSDDFPALRDRLAGLVGDRSQTGRSGLASDNERFAGLRAGDIRLEQALARLRQAGRPAADEMRPAVEPRPASALTAGVKVEPRCKDLPQRQPTKLLSPGAAAAATSAFKRLADVIASKERSIDDITSELVRPMLKGWLDDNLPGIVERLVREEIERIARRGGK